MAYKYKFWIKKGKDVFVSKKMFDDRKVATQAMVNTADKLKGVCGNVVVQVVKIGGAR